MARLSGKIWQQQVPRQEVDAIREKLNVISTRLLAGRTMVRVMSDRSPGDGFEPAVAELEDVYFATVGAA